MLVDDLSANIKQIIKDAKGEGVAGINLKIWTNEKKKRASAIINIKMTQRCFKRQSSFPYVVILVLGGIFLWGMFECPGCRSNKISERHTFSSVAVTNRFDLGVISRTNICSGSISDICCSTNRME